MPGESEKRVAEKDVNVVQVEVVHVLSGHRLLDGRAEARTYWRRDGQGLVPGVYIAKHQPDAPGTLLDGDVEFRGPFKSYDAAMNAANELCARLEARGIRAIAIALPQARGIPDGALARSGHTGAGPGGRALPPDTTQGGPRHGA